MNLVDPDDAEGMAAAQPEMKRVLAACQQAKKELEEAKGGLQKEIREAEEAAAVAKKEREEANQAKATADATYQKSSQAKAQALQQHAAAQQQAEQQEQGQQQGGGALSLEELPPAPEERPSYVRWLFQHKYDAESRGSVEVDQVEHILYDLAILPRSRAVATLLDVRPSPQPAMFRACDRFLSPSLGARQHTHTVRQPLCVGPVTWSREG